MHIRRRLSEAEATRVNAICDIRGTREETTRLKAVMAAREAHLRAWETIPPDIGVAEPSPQLSGDGFTLKPWRRGWVEYLELASCNPEIREHFYDGATLTRTTAGLASALYASAWRGTQEPRSRDHFRLFGRPLAFGVFVAGDTWCQGLVLLDHLGDHLVLHGYLLPHARTPGLATGAARAAAAWGRGFGVPVFGGISTNPKARRVANWALRA